MSCKPKKLKKENNLNKYGKMFNNSQKLLTEFCKIINNVLDEQEEYTRENIRLLYKPSYEYKYLNINLILGNYESYNYLEYIENKIYYSIGLFKSKIIEKMSKSRFATKFLMYTLEKDFDDLTCSQIYEIYKFNQNKDLKINYIKNIISREFQDLSNVTLTKLEYEKIIFSYIIVFLAKKIDQEKKQIYLSEYDKSKLIVGYENIFYTSSGKVKSEDFLSFYKNEFNNTDLIKISKKIISDNNLKTIELEGFLEKEIPEFINSYKYEEINKTLNMLGTNLVIEKKFDIYIIKKT